MAKICCHLVICLVAMGLVYFGKSTCSFCPQGIQYNNSLVSVCFWIESIRRLFQDQNGYCGNSGGTLAIFRDNETFQYIKDTSGSWLITDEDYWIGIEMNLTSLRYGYIDGGPLTFVQWSPYETDFNQPCVILKNWEMHPQKCTAKLKRGICSKEMSINESLEPTLSSFSTVDNMVHSSTVSQEGTSMPLYTTTESCTLYCTCLAENITGTGGNIQITLDALKKELTLMKNSTNAYLRSKISVYENRISARGMGILGITVIAVVFLFIFSLDFISLG